MQLPSADPPIPRPQNVNRLPTLGANVPPPPGASRVCSPRPRTTARLGTGLGGVPRPQTPAPAWERARFLSCLLPERIGVL